MAGGPSPTHSLSLPTNYATESPFGTASKDCILGYNALCSFTPISTVIMVGLAVMHIVLDRSAKKKAAQES